MPRNLHPPHGHHPPGSAPDPFDPVLEGVAPLSVDVFRAFKRSMILNRHLMMAALAAEDAHPAQAFCLLALSRTDGLSQSELASVLHVSRPTVTTMLQKMEAAGIVERRTDEHDQRVTRLYLTPEGRRLAERMRAVHAEVIDSTIGSLPEADRRELLRLLQVLNEHAAAMLHESGDAR
jgi:DNA-binding MarR family transcriptional regulator